MHPVICSIGPLTIYYYGLMLVLAFSVCSALLMQQAARQKINPEEIFNFCFTVFIFGVIGARIFYVLQYLDQYLKDPIEIIMLQHGGLSWFGSLILGSAAGVVYIRRKKMPLYQTLDLLVPFAALGQAIGRIGCLLNGCCYGKESGFGFYFTSQNAVLIPTQLYSSLGLILIFLILRFLQERPHRGGEIFYLYLALYSLKRFFMEYFRGDTVQAFLGLTLFQILSVMIFSFAIYKLIMTSKEKA